MRWLLTLLSFLALAVAPLATPAEAMPRMSEAHCAEGMGQAAHHAPDMPMPEDGKCCVAVPAALPPVALSLAEAEMPQMAEPMLAVSQLAGLSAEAEDPPPRA